MNIGVFDSGVGGLWILNNLQNQLPNNNYIFFGDQEHIPYGNKSLEEIKVFSETIVQFLIDKGCAIIVIACNTASAASLLYLRQKFPKIIFVGMEPAIKPAVEKTHTGKVGVLATRATFQGELYNSVVERFANHVEIFKDTCDGLVEQIENDNLETQDTENILKRALLPMINKNIDTVVLGCTHYPFVIPQIRKIVGNNINIIDPTEAIVRRVDKIINENNLKNDNFEKKDIIIYTSGDIDNLKIIVKKLFKKDLIIEKFNW